MLQGCAPSPRQPPALQDAQSRWDPQPQYPTANTDPRQQQGSATAAPKMDRDSRSAQRPWLILLRRPKWPCGYLILNCYEQPVNKFSLAASEAEGSVIL